MEPLFKRQRIEARPFTGQARQPRLQGDPIHHRRLTGRLSPTTVQALCARRWDDWGLLERPLIAPVNGGQMAHIADIKFDPIGRLLLVADNTATRAHATGSLRIIDMKRFALQRGDDEVLTLPTPSWLSSARWNPGNDNEVATGSGSLGGVHIWDLETTTGLPAQSLLRIGGVDLQWWPGGPTDLVAGGARGLVLWDRRHRPRVLDSPVAVGSLTSVLPLADCGYEVACGTDGGEVLVVDLRRPALPTLQYTPVVKRVDLQAVIASRIGQAGLVEAAALVAGGVGRSGKTAEHWVPCAPCRHTGYTPITRCSYAVHCLVPSPLGGHRCVAHTATGITVELDLKTGRTHQLHCPPPLRLPVVCGIAVSGAGPPVVCVPSADACVALVDWTHSNSSALFLRDFPLPAPAVCAAFHPRMEALVVGTLGGAVFSVGWQPHKGMCPYPLP